MNSCDVKLGSPLFVHMVGLKQKGTFKKKKGKKQ